MTRRLKSVLTVVLLFVMAVTGVLAVSAVSANAEEKDPTVVAFETKMQYLCGLDTSTDEKINDLLVDKAFQASILEVREAYSRVPTGIKSQIDTDITDLYTKLVMNACNDMLLIYDFEKATAYKKVDPANIGTGDRLYFSDKESFEAEKTRYEGLTEKQKVFADAIITGSVAIPNITAGLTEIGNMEGRLAAALTAIENIEGFDSTSMVKYVDEATTPIALGSETSISAATTALNEVYGSDIAGIFTAKAAEKEFFKKDGVDLYQQYLTLKGIYDNLLEPVTLVDAEIEALGWVDGVTCLSIEKAIKDAYDHYMNLSPAADNDLRSKVKTENATKIQNAYTDLGNVNNEVAAVVAAISSIGTVDFNETNVDTDATNDASILAIVNAETLYDALDTDIKAAPATYISNYTTKITARSTYDALKGAADTVITLIKALPSVEQDPDGDVYGKFIEMQTKYLVLDAEQIAYVDNTEVSPAYKTNLNNCKKLYDYFNAKAQEIYKKAVVYKNLVSELGTVPNDVTITAEYLAKIVACEDYKQALEDSSDEIDRLALNALDINDITKMETARNAYDAIATKAGTWKTAVEAMTAASDIGATTAENLPTDLASVEAAKATYVGILDDYASALENNDDYKEAYAKYIAAVAKYDEVTGKINNVLELMRAIVTIPAPTTDTEIDTFISAYDAAKAAFAEFEDEETTTIKGAKEMIEANEVEDANENTAYENYQLATSIYALPNLVKKVSALTDPDSMTFADVAAVTEAEGVYGDLTDDQKTDFATNYSTLDTKLTNAIAKRDDLVEALNDWIDDVYALITVDGAVIDVNDLKVLDLTEVATLKSTYEDYDEDQKKYITNVTTNKKNTDVKALFDAIELQGSYTYLDELITRMNEMIDKTSHTPEDLAKMQIIETEYNALTASQKTKPSSYEKVEELADTYVLFLNVAEKKVFTDSYTAAVNALKAEVATNYYSEESKTIIYILESIYNYCTQEYQEFIKNAYADLLVVKEKYAAVDIDLTEDFLKVELAELVGEDGKIAQMINDINTINNSLAELLDEDGVIDTINGDIDAIKGDIDTIKGDINTVNGDIDTIKGDINSLVGRMDALLDAAGNGKIKDITDDINSIKNDISSLQSAIATINDATEGIYARALAAAKEYVDQQVGIINNALAAINDETTGIYATAKGYVDQKIGDINTALQQGTQMALEQIGSIGTTIASTKAELEGKIATAKSEIEGAIASVKAELEEKIATAKNELNNKLIELESKLQKELDDTNKTLSTTKTIAIVSLIVAIISLAAGVVCIIKAFGKKY